MIDLVIRGGQVVTPDGVGLWDVAVEASVSPPSPHPIRFPVMSAG